MKVIKKRMLLYILYLYNKHALLAYWQGRQGSNLRMSESKSDALPLGDSPITFHYIPNLNDGI